MLLTGNVATQSLLGQTGITKLRGEWHEWNGRYVMPIFHPAYLLRNPRTQTPAASPDELRNNPIITSPGAIFRKSLKFGVN
jgi:uracil-DNA glycosylase